MQNHLNQLTCLANFGHADWRSMEFNWGLAIVDEVMEIHGHLGWKWWKGSDKYQVGLTEENKKQVQLEVIDILHFGLSKSMQVDQKELGTVAFLEAEDTNIVYMLKWVAIAAMELQDFSWMDFNSLCQLVELDATEIMEIYTGKYALNIFRQDHGYGEGTYLKEWLIPEISIKYQEDNWYLEQAIANCHEAGQPVTVKAITLYLENWFSKATGGK
jgi:hypothetical protein